MKLRTDLKGCGSSKTWGWAKSALYVDVDNATLYLGKDKVISVAVEGNEFTMDNGSR